MADLAVARRREKSVGLHVSQPFALRSPRGASRIPHQEPLCRVRSVMNDNHSPGAGPSSGRETRSRGRPATSSPPPLSIPQPHASSSLSSPNVMTRRVLGTPLRKRRRGSGQGVRQGSFDGSPGDLAEYVEAGEDESHLFFEKRKRQRRWLCERERVLRANSLHKILQREVSNQGNLGFAKRASSERFRRMQAQQTFNTYDAKENERWKLSFLKKRSRVVEIVSTASEPPPPPHHLSSMADSLSPSLPLSLSLCVRVSCRVGGSQGHDLRSRPFRGLCRLQQGNWEAPVLPQHPGGRSREKPFLQQEQRHAHHRQRLRHGQLLFPQVPVHPTGIHSQGKA